MSVTRDEPRASHTSQSICMKSQDSCSPPVQGILGIQGVQAAHKDELVLSWQSRHGSLMKTSPRVRCISGRRWQLCVWWSSSRVSNFFYDFLLASCRDSGWRQQQEEEELLQVKAGVSLMKWLVRMPVESLILGPTRRAIGMRFRRLWGCNIWGVFPAWCFVFKA